MLSIIIPTYNEQEKISALINYIKHNSFKGHTEIIICDGGSSDETIKEAANAGAITLRCPKKGRAAQMNYGASHANGDILYFIHADTFPPDSFVDDINEAIAAGYALGRYRTKFDSKKRVLKMNAFFTRFDLFMCYGGDQTLFIKRELFIAIKGFDETMLIMEDYEIISRAREKAKYRIMPKNALVSARKYDCNSWISVQKANYTIVQMYKKGASQTEMVDEYKKRLRY